MTTTSRRPPLLAAVVLSACVGLVAGAGSAWAIYQRLGPAERVVSAPTQGGGGSSGPTIQSIAAAAAPSLVKVLTRPVAAGDLLTQPAGFACGFVVSPDGLVVTSAHALAGATRLRVAFADGHVADAAIAGADPAHGIVVLRAAGVGGLTPLSFARNQPRPGDLAIAVGSPPFAALNVISGTVNATGRALATGGSGPAAASVLDALTVDATPDAADDGAPLLDGGGGVIGVVVALPDSAALRGLAALSGRDAAALVDSLSHGGSSQRTTFGADSLVLDPATAAAAGLPVGALIRSVTAGGPAAAAGLVPGDVVTAVNGTAVDADHPLDAGVFGLDPGQRVTLSLWREGQTSSVALTVAAG